MSMKENYIPKQRIQSIGEIKKGHALIQHLLPFFP